MASLPGVQGSEQRLNGIQTQVLHRSGEKANAIFLHVFLHYCKPLTLGMIT